MVPRSSALFMIHTVAALSSSMSDGPSRLSDTAAATVSENVIHAASMSSSCVGDLLLPFVFVLRLWLAGLLQHHLVELLEVGAVGLPV